jgi:hypothetical protein
MGMRTTPFPGRLAGTVLALLAAAASGQAFAESWVVPQELWAQPRTGALIRAQPDLRECVRGYLADRSSRLVIHYGAGEEAALQAEELRAWLVALAVAAEKVELARDQDGSGQMSIELITTKSKKDGK